MARHGYGAATVRDLVALAGVSKSTFYDHFESKEDCFLATYEGVAAGIANEMAAACEESGEPRDGLRRALGRLAAIAEERPAALSLVIVDSLTLGAPALARREAHWRSFEATWRRHLGAPGPATEASDLTARAVVGGLNGVVSRCLRRGRGEELRGLVEPLIVWAFSYAEPPSEATSRAVAAAELPAPPPPARNGTNAPGWEEPPDSPRSRSSLSQRERISRAAVRVVVERGYEALSIPAISAVAGTSNQTFYENFDSKRDAFLAGYESVAAGALGRASAALSEAEDGPAAVGAALRALTESIAESELYARLAFFELPSAGPPGLDRIDETIDLLAFFLERGRASDEAPPPVGQLATAAGLWFAIQREIAQGRRQALPEAASELARIALAPLAL